MVAPAATAGFLAAWSIPPAVSSRQVHSSSPTANQHEAPAAAVKYPPLNSDQNGGRIPRRHPASASPWFRGTGSDCSSAPFLAPNLLDRGPTTTRPPTRQTSQQPGTTFSNQKTRTPSQAGGSSSHDPIPAPSNERGNLPADLGFHKDPLPAQPPTPIIPTP